MGTDSRDKDKAKHRLRRSYFVLLLLFVWLVVLVFTWMQYNRERMFKEALLDSSLQQVNITVADGLRMGEPVGNLYTQSLRHHPELRLTVMDVWGNVRYDSSLGADGLPIGNHASRPEIREALEMGRGYTVRRLSESMQQDYFYSALRADSLIIRTSLPYTVELDRRLNIAHSFVWFIVAITFLVSILAYAMLRRMQRADEALEHERRRVHYEEQQQVRIKRQLTGSINHELKTPVSAISACLETLTANPQMDEATRQQFIAQCYHHAQRLTGLLGDIATINRMDEAPDIIARTPLSLRALIGEVVDDIGQEYAPLSMSIEVENFGHSPLEMTGNAALLRSVFLNLISNALHYSGGTRIVIRFLCEELDDTDTRYYHFHFYDNGVGVSREHLPHLFERFYRVDKGRSRKLGGTGLGLSIVKNAILLHGGTIEVTNRPEGGLEFNFSLRAN